LHAIWHPSIRANSCAEACVAENGKIARGDYRSSRPEGSLATPSGADLDPYVLWLRLRSHRRAPQEVVLEGQLSTAFLGIDEIILAC